MPNDLSAKDRNELYYRCFKNEVGRAVLADMRRRAYCDRTTFVRLPSGEVDVKTMLTREGARDFVQTTCDYVKAAEQPKPPRQKKAVSQTAEETPSG